MKCLNNTRINSTRIINTRINNTRINSILKVKNSLLESEKDFKPIKVSADYKDKFEEKEINKKRTVAKSTWYDLNDWLINYIPEPIKKRWVAF